MNGFAFTEFYIETFAKFLEIFLMGILKIYHIFLDRISASPLEVRLARLP